MPSSLWRAAFSKWNLLSSIIETAYYYPLIQIYNGLFLEILVYNHYFTIIVNVHNSWYISRVYSKYPININFQPLFFHVSFRMDGARKPNETNPASGDAITDSIFQYMGEQIRRGEEGIASISFVKRAVIDVYILYKVVNRLCKAVLRIILSL